MRVQPVMKGQPTFTNSNPRPLFKGQLNNKNNVSKTEEKEFQKVLKEIEDYDKKNLFDVEKYMKRVGKAKVTANTRVNTIN